MKLSDVYELLDAVAPKTLSDEYCARFQAYDNSGILVDTGEDIQGVVFSLDLSFGAIDKAVATGANLIVTHHPAIYGKIASVRAGEIEPLGEKLVACIRRGISVVAMHLNLDTAKGGIDESLCEGICLASGGAFDGNAEIMHPLEDGGYGRVYNVNATRFFELANGICEIFDTKRVLVYGPNETVRKVASFCGAGADEESVAFAIKNGADTIVSADWKHHLLAFALERGLKVIDMTHYASEFYGFEKYYKKISRAVGVPCALHTDRVLL